MCPASELRKLLYTFRPSSGAHVANENKLVLPCLLDDGIQVRLGKGARELLRDDQLLVGSRLELLELLGQLRVRRKDGCSFWH